MRAGARRNNALTLGSALHRLQHFPVSIEWMATCRMSLNLERDGAAVVLMSNRTLLEP